MTETNRPKYYYLKLKYVKRCIILTTGFNVSKPIVNIIVQILEEVAIIYFEKNKQLNKVYY